MLEKSAGLIYDHAPQNREARVQDPIQAKLARARTKLEAVERWGADPARSERQRRRASSLARSCRAIVQQREDAVLFELGERLKLLRGDRNSRCMFLWEDGAEG